MLITKTVIIKWARTNKRWYVERKYIFTKMGDEFEVKVEDLQKGCSAKIQCSCDYCLKNNVNTLMEKTFSQYRRDNLENLVHTDSCMKCRYLKAKECNLIRYGTENSRYTEENMKKLKIKKYTAEEVRQKFIDLNFTPLFTNEEYYATDHVNKKVECFCNNHPDIIQYKDFHTVMVNKGCKYCSAENNRGENHYKWSGGESSINHYLRQCQEMKYWRYDSLKYNQFRCYLTNRKGKDLEVHHQNKSFMEIVMAAIEEAEIKYKPLMSDYSEDELIIIRRKLLKMHYKEGYGILLTKELHMQFHKIYGFGNNNSEQFHEFCNTYWYGDLDKLTKDNYKELLVKFI